MSEVSENIRETVSFKRFLSYIYAYEDDRKLRNVGFVKAEIRYGKIRMQVVVSGLNSKGGKPLELCLLDDELKRTVVSQVHLQNGRGEFRSASGLDNLWNSGLSYDAVCGVCLQGAGDRRYYYMTLWRERKITQSLSETADKKDSPENAKGIEPCEKKSGSLEKDYPIKIGNPKRIETSEKKSEGYGKDNLIETDKVKGIKGVGMKKEADEEKHSIEIGEAKCVEDDPAESVNQGCIHEQGKEKEDDPAEPANQGCIEIELKKEELDSDSEEDLNAELEAASELIRQSEERILHASEIALPSCLEVKKKDVDRRMGLWKKFCSRYPHVDIRPVSLKTESGEEHFSENRKVCEVLRIRPNDIGRLPRNNWVLAHNSFLQHAYNHNRHLILYRMEYRQEGQEWNNRWFLGIPGSCDAQETVVAEVFGLKNYMTCKNGGFWYTEVSMGEYS